VSARRLHAQGGVRGSDWITDDALLAIAVPACMYGRCEHSRGARLFESFGIHMIDSHDRTFLFRIRGPYAPRVGLMVMIDLVDEKKSLGVISVT
jgi:hypothetical protein